MITKVFAEVGIGNPSFFSTEFENGKKEYRITKFILPNKIQQLYIRIWIFKLVLVISLFKGIFLRKKNKNNLKLILGIGGLKHDK